MLLGTAHSCSKHSVYCIFSGLPNASQVRPCLASEIRCDWACNNVKKSKPWKSLWIRTFLVFFWHARNNKMEVLSQLCFLLNAPTHPYYCEQCFLKIKAHWFVCYFRLWEEGQAGTLSKYTLLVPLRTYKYTYLPPLQTSSLPSRESSWCYITVYHFMAVMCSRVLAGSEAASFPLALTQVEMHVMSCISLTLPHCSAIIFLADDTALKPPSPLPPCVAAAAGRPDLCSASPYRGCSPEAAGLCSRDRKETAQGRTHNHSWGLCSLLSRVTHTAPELMKINKIQ